ncbi:hypothetical protein GCM10007063_23060 [Lentibacillus kapialis]|uniref:Uncharacterized protein n=1 Tax=Lentibacillus kapialis TaxID=340214 RepID=A0A917PY04_9BACI|nr:hypothetical protein [Lentibacillus kapialis]GGK00052.1 hypothetical protein GCM10007063_23060 [Lentibacillus kapialis]
MNKSSYTFKTNNDVNIIKHIRNQVPVHIITTVSDIGCLRVGNERFITFVPNGCRGDISTVVITERYACIPLQYYTTLNGTFNIYDFDSGDEIVLRLNGEYDVHNASDIIVFNKK